MVWEAQEMDYFLQSEKKQNEKRRKARLHPEGFQCLEKSERTGPQGRKAARKCGAEDVQEKKDVKKEAMANRGQVRPSRKTSH